MSGIKTRFAEGWNYGSTELRRDGVAGRMLPWIVCWRIALLKSHFYKGARILVKGDEVRLEVRDLRNMTGPLHEMELVPLINLWGAAMLDATFKLGGGRQVNGNVLSYYIWEVLMLKYQATISGGIIMAPGGGYKTIIENEEKDSYFYLRDYSGGETSWFEGLIMHTPEGVKEYTHLTYDVEWLIGVMVERRKYGTKD